MLRVQRKRHVGPALLRQTTARCDTGGCGSGESRESGEAGRRGADWPGKPLRAEHSPPLAPSQGLNGGLGRATCQGPQLRPSGSAQCPSVPQEALSWRPERVVGRSSCPTPTSQRSREEHPPQPGGHPLQQPDSPRGTARQTLPLHRRGSRGTGAASCPSPGEEAAG